MSVAVLVPRPGVATGLEDLPGRVTVGAPAAGVPGTLWLHTLAAPRAAEAGDVFLATLGVLPRRLAVPGVLMVHDLTPLTRPRHHTVVNRLCFSAYAVESVAEAAAVVCLSEATRRRLQAWLPGRATADARVIGPGVDAFFSPPPPGAEGTAVRQRFAAGRPFLVHLGTLEPRKGVATLVAAHGALCRRGAAPPDLVLAGGRGWGANQVDAALAAHPEPGRVHRPGYVSREDARELLRHAEVVVAASEEEGFGLPVAEAMACGAVCVTSDDAALLEAAAGAAEVFPRGSADGLADALARALAAPRRALLRQASLARAAALGWDGPGEAWHTLLGSLTMPKHAAIGD